MREIPDDDALLAFHAGTATDDQARTLDQILQWDDARLERTHDYIQWLFPNQVPSPVNPSAPVVTARHRQAFAQRPELRQNLLRALQRMLDFYCLQSTTEQGMTRISPSADWPTKHPRWLTRGNHNHLRLTRILKCLNLLGLPDQATALFASLDAIAHGEEGAAISQTTHQFWKDAAERVPKG
jgi:hypothetical protein